MSENVSYENSITNTTAPSPEKGLTSEQVSERVAQGRVNLPVTPPSKSIGQIILTNTFTFFNLVFFALGLCLVLVGAFRDLIFLPVVVCNTLIGIVQEIRAKRTLDKLKIVSAPKSLVVREGKKYITESEHLVTDDIVILTAGEQICADAYVLTGQVQVNEALVTGEEKPVIKEKGDKLLSGSFIVSGECRACVCAVGEEAYSSRILIQAKKHRKQQPPEMMRALKRIIQVIGIILIPVGALLFYRQAFTGGMETRQATVSTVAALVGMIPEGLYLLASIALMVSVIRLAKNKTLVHELNCIETLSHVDVLCVDKTGTITEKEMIVEKTELLDGVDEEKLNTVVSALFGCVSDNNQTACAIRNHFNQSSDWCAEKVIDFDSNRKSCAASFGEKGAYVAGAPEFVLKEKYEQYKETIEAYSGEGYRVIVVCEFTDKLDGDITPLGFVLLANKIRATARETFEYFAEQGVGIKVISGDNPITVSRVAVEAGIENAENYIDAQSLTDYNAIADAVEKYTVFGRVKPEQKRDIIRALKEFGHTVCMTGDGVNDVLALKDADCSIAMASGSDAACHVSQLVLLDSDFASMPHVVSEGRRVINNIERSSSLFLVKNIFSFAFAILTLALGFPYPITPAQLSLVSVFTIGTPAFLLALEPNSNRVSGKFISNVIKKALPGGIANVILVLGLEIFVGVFGLSMDEMSTMCAIIMGTVGLIVLFKACKPLNLWRGVIWLGMFIGITLGATVFGAFFVLTKLSLKAVLILAVFILLAYPVVHALEWCGRSLYKLKKKIDGIV